MLMRDEAVDPSVESLKVSEEKEIIERPEPITITDPIILHSGEQQIVPVSE